MLIAQQGGRTRRHKYFRDMGVVSVPVLAAGLLQCLIYALAFSRSSREDWQNFTIVAIALIAILALAAITLTAFRRHEAPIVSATAVTAIIFSFAVSLLSAMRVPVSYLGLVLCLPVAVTIMAYANLRFHRVIGRKVAIAEFPGVEAVRLWLPKAPVLTSPEAELSEIDYLLIDPAHHHTERWSPLLAACYLANVEVLPWTRFMEIQLGRVDVRSFRITHVSYSPSQIAYARLKGYLDRLAVLVTLPLTLPIGALVALFILIRDGGPVIFVQHRRGFAGRPFRMYKFRTMYRGSSGAATSRDDRRIIAGCRWMRKLRLDELPQLYNILMGDMSLIGPRPEAVNLVRWYGREIPEYAHRLLVLPGITGWAQVSSGYTSNPAEARLKLSYDLYYIKYLSFDLDLLILFKTVRTVLFGSGAR